MKEFIPNYNAVHIKISILKTITSSCSRCLRCVFLLVWSKFRVSSSCVRICMLSLYSTENWDCRHLYSVLSTIICSGRCCSYKQNTASPILTKKWLSYFDKTFILIVLLSQYNDVWYMKLTSVLSFSISVKASWWSLLSFSSSVSRFVANSFCSSSSYIISSNYKQQITKSNYYCT